MGVRDSTETGQRAEVAPEKFSDKRTQKAQAGPVTKARRAPPWTELKTRPIGGMKPSVCHQNKATTGVARRRNETDRVDPEAVT